jgi:CHAT domain-containing protein
MVADPSGKLDVEHERRQIEAAIAPHEKAGTVRLTWVPGATMEALLEVVDKGEWHVFHFIGHGGAPPSSDGDIGEEEGFIVFSDGQGGYREVGARDLTIPLRGGPSVDSLRLVVLNCCDSARATAKNPLSSPAAALVAAGVPAVVAMQFPISDHGAIQFAGVFYGELTQGRAVEAAITSARRRMWAKPSIEWGIPVLYTRSKTGRLFKRSSVPEPGPPIPSGPFVDEKTRRARERLQQLYAETGM